MFQNIQRSWLVILVLLLMLTAIACQAQPQVSEVTRVVSETIELEGETVEVTRVVIETEVVEVTRVVVETQPEEAATDGSRIVIGLDSEPNTFDPHQTIGRFSESFMSNVFDGLTLHDQDGALIPGLATSWEALDDNTWEFKLREGVTFHNGNPFNAESVKFTLDRVLDEERNAPIRPLLENITSVEIVDDFTVHISIASPDLLLPARLAELYGSILDPAYVQENGDDFIALNPVGTGPFKFVEWVKDERIVLEVNEDYWGEVPQVQEIIFRPIKDNGARVAALLAGEVDIVNGIPIAQEPVVANYPGVRSVPVPVPRIYYVSMDVRTPPFDNILVRQAVNYAIDREGIVENLFAGFGVPAAVAHPRASWGFNPDLEPYPYNPDRARELLADAGYPDGFDTEFDTFVGRLPAHDTIAQAVVAQLAEVGINAEVNALEFGVFSERRVGDQHAPLFIYSIGDWALEPVWMYDWLTQGQAGHYWSPPEWEALLTELSATYEPEPRIPLYQEVQEMMFEEAPLAAVAELETIWGIRDGVFYEPRPDETLKFASVRSEP